MYKIEMKRAKREIVRAAYISLCGQRQRLQVRVGFGERPRARVARQGLVEDGQLELGEAALFAEDLPAQPAVVPSVVHVERGLAQSALGGALVLGPVVLHTKKGQSGCGGSVRVQWISQYVAAQLASCELAQSM